MQRILVIDDDSEMRAFIVELLTRHGYEVSEARDGNEGLAAFERNPADLVITDLFMPEKEGCETILELRKRWPQTRIIAMSGGSRIGHNFLPVAERLGANQVLHKPMPPQNLLDAVRNALNAAIMLLASVTSMLAA